jgi:hypothetical protein
VIGVVCLFWLNWLLIAASLLLVALMALLRAGQTRWRAATRALAAVRVCLPPLAQRRFRTVLRDGAPAVIAVTTTFNRGAAVLLLAIALIALGCQAKGFDAAAWQAQRGNLARDNPRSAMVSALERTVVLKGMTRDETRRLLGEPDRSEAEADEYLLGASPVGVDLEVYRLEFRLEFRQQRVALHGIRRQ